MSYSLTLEISQPEKKFFSFYCKRSLSSFVAKLEIYLSDLTLKNVTGFCIITE